MRWWRARPLAVDALSAVVIGTAVALASVPAAAGQPGVRGVDGPAVALVAAGAAGLVVRRRWPGAAMVVTLGTTMTFLVLGYPYGPIFVLGGVAMYSVAAWRGLRYTVVAALAAIVLHAGWAVWFENDAEGPLLAIVASTAWTAAAIGTGLAVRARRETVARAQVEERRRIGYEERLRLAQEVHDAVGHSLAVISMNAGAALHVLGKPGPPPPAPLQRSLHAIRQASNGALDELRATLATFTGTLAAPATPEPAAVTGLGGVPRLVAATDVDGLAVRLDVDGVPSAPVPPTVDQVGYRIVQEALANVVRHAAARRAEVRIAYRPDAVAITVTDDGRGPAGGPPAAGGTGLASMRERARAVGGTLTAGARPDGGFEVHAELPA